MESVSKGGHVVGITVYCATVKDDLDLEVDAPFVGQQSVEV
jgi:hypothetical protein